MSAAVEQSPAPVAVVAPGGSSSHPAPIAADLQRIQQGWAEWRALAPAEAAADLSSVRSTLSLLWQHRDVMTVALLRETGIGKALNALKKKRQWHMLHREAAMSRCEQLADSPVLDLCRLQ